MKDEDKDSSLLFIPGFAMLLNMERMAFVQQLLLRLSLMRLLFQSRLLLDRGPNPSQYMMPTLG